jgi:selenide, water dikinase
VLSGLSVPALDRVLVDYRTHDDAGVYRLNDQTAIVQTVDFFTPVVDDPFAYGEIAAANALSDVYAMGGRPLTALAIAAFPDGDVDTGIVQAIFRGGLAKLREAGVALLGGHTVRDREIKFGYAVTGQIAPDGVWTNARARPGDVLILTKPLGTGVVSTAIKYGRAPDSIVEAATLSMRTLNRAAAEVLLAQPAGSVHACTDVTGFGLAGHGSLIAAQSEVTIEIEADRVPLFDGVDAMVEGNLTGGGRSNEDFFGPRVRVGAHVATAMRALLFDPQTSGGLLVAVSPQVAGALEPAFEEAGIHGVRIGVVGRGRGADQPLLDVR